MRINHTVRESVCLKEREIGQTGTQLGTYPMLANNVQVYGQGHPSLPSLLTEMLDYLLFLTLIFDLDEPQIKKLLLNNIQPSGETQYLNTQ